MPYWAGGALVALVVMSYVFFGGMRGTAWVNTLQTLMFLAFGLLAVAVVGAGMGGFGHVFSRDARRRRAQAALLTRERVSPWYFFSYTFIPLSSIAFPHIGIFCLTAKKLSHFKRTVVLYPICMLAIWLPCVFLGVAANRATDVPAIKAKLDARATIAAAGPTLDAAERDRLRRAASGDDVMLRLVEHYAPVWLIGLLGASVMAAVMASDSQILALSTMFTEDVFTFYGGTARFGPNVQVQMGRLFVVLLTLVAYAIALRVPQSIFDLASQFAFAGYSALSPLLVAALFWRRSTKWGALAVVIWVGARDRGGRRDPDERAAAGRTADGAVGAGRGAGPVARRRRPAGLQPAAGGAADHRIRAADVARVDGDAGARAAHPGALLLRHAVPVMTRRLVARRARRVSPACRRGLGRPPAQVSVSSPYLDIVARYQAGDQPKAVADMAAYPTSGLRDRARKDLRDLTCQVLCGTADCRRARAEKPAEFERVLEAWSASMPAAAALHVDTAIQAQAEDRRDVAEAHRQLALELVDLMETELAAPAGPGTSPIARPRIADGPAFSGPTRTGPDPQIARRAQASQLVTLLSIWLLQLRGDLPQIQAPLARAQQRFPQDPLVALALGSLHEAHAAPNALVEASAGRQGNLEKWRQEERAYRLEQALVAYRQAVALDPTLAEAHLRLGHVLLLTGKVDEADAAFARASAETGDRRWRYLAEMLRADGADARGDRAAARQRYQAALEAWPDAQSPVLALSRLEASDGDWPAAQARLSTLAPRAGGRAEDPWWAYGFGQAWRIDAGLATLRRLVVR